ncbi:hypothetical protein [Bdellovibrio sp. HCB337]|uniref:hypothetical protein n=1 Tax=Bdellovibrio sp. HCB337 TaxID=3394358 RepID=UPI0039A444DD
MILALLMSLNAMACMSTELAPVVLTPTKSYQLKVDRLQEVILDGGTQLPKITGIKGSSEKGKPMLTVMSGLQVLEKGQMKSYPHRVSIKMNEAEKDWQRPVEVSFAGADGKAYTMNIEWLPQARGCSKPVIK